MSPSLAVESQVKTPDREASFVRLLTASQRELYTYVNTLMAGSPMAEDVLQETNLDLWARMDNYDNERPFLPWAYSFAYQRVLAFRKKQLRSRLVFSDDVMQSISDAYVNGEVRTDARAGVLLDCLDKLDKRHATLIRDRYMANTSVTTLAQRAGCSVNQISARLYRIRKSLAKCIASSLKVDFR
jgi:RNA polymerase sigma-70 factor, ECF subfamily